MSLGHVSDQQPYARTHSVYLISSRWLSLGSIATTEAPFLSAARVLLPAAAGRPCVCVQEGIGEKGAPFLIAM
jgi:hypothetical protein